MTVYDQHIDPFSQPTTIELADARNWICECGCDKHVNLNGGPEANHAIIHDRKRYHSEVTRAWNLQLVAKNHHEMQHVTEARLAFYRKQCSRYGRPLVDGALLQLPIEPSEISMFLLDENEEELFEEMDEEMKKEYPALYGAYGELDEK